MHVQLLSEMKISIVPWSFALAIQNAAALPLISPRNPQSGVHRDAGSLLGDLAEVVLSPVLNLVDLVVRNSGLSHLKIPMLQRYSMPNTSLPML